MMLRRKYATFMSNDTLELSEAHYVTRVDLSYVFAKLTIIIDEAPYDYDSACLAVSSVLELLEQLRALVRGDPGLVGTLYQYLQPRLAPLVAKVLVDSFLDSCVARGAAAPLEAAFAHFELVLLKLTLLAAHRRGARYRCKHTVEIAPTQACDILDRLFLLAAQHRRPGENDPAARVLGCAAKYLIWSSPNAAILEYLCHKLLAANGPASGDKLHLTVVYIDAWHEKVAANGRRGPLEREIDRIGQLKEALLRRPLTNEVCWVVLSLNRLVMCMQVHTTTDGHPYWMPQPSAQYSPSTLEEHSPALTFTTASAPTPPTPAEPAKKSRLDIRRLWRKKPA